MKLPSAYHERREAISISMTPMIDVVFLLIIFFVWTSSFQIVEYILPSSLRTSGGTAATTAQIDPAEDFDRVVVRLFFIDGRPQWTVNNTPAGSLPEVRRTLGTVAGIHSDAPVVIDPEANVPLGHVIDVYDICRQVGFAQVQLAASAEPGA